MPNKLHGKIQTHSGLLIPFGGKNGTKYAQKEKLRPIGKITTNYSVERENRHFKKKNSDKNNKNNIENISNKLYNKICFHIYGINLSSYSHYRQVIKSMKFENVVKE